MTEKTILPVALSRQLKRSKPLKVVYREQSIVLYRSEGRVSAFLDRCPHRGFPLSKGCVKDKKLVCGYHGWAFDEKGRLADIPGDPEFTPCEKALLRNFHVREKDGLIWLCDELFSADEVFSPSVHGSHDCVSTVQYINANKIDIAENFLDALHTHTVHSGIVRSSSARHKCSVDIENVEQGYQATYTEEQQQTGFVSRLFGGNIISSVGRIQFPGVIELEYMSDAGIEMSVVIYVVEEGQDRCKLILRTYLRKTKIPFFIKMSFLGPIQMWVLWQDKRVLERLAKALREAPDFIPAIRKTDIMRPYIQKVFNGEFVECRKRVDITL